MKRISRDIYKLDTGKEIYAYCGQIGFSDENIITGGYDNHLYDKDLNEESDTLTTDELIDIADYMLDCWNNFKKQIKD